MASWYRFDLRRRGGDRDAFRDANGELVETEEFFAVCRLYSVLAADGG